MPAVTVDEHIARIEGLADAEQSFSLQDLIGQTVDDTGLIMRRRDDAVIPYRMFSFAQGKSFYLCSPMVGQDSGCTILAFLHDGTTARKASDLFAAKPPYQEVCKYHETIRSCMAVVEGWRTYAVMNEKLFNEQSRVPAFNPSVLVGRTLVQLVMLRNKKRSPVSSPAYCVVFFDDGNALVLDEGPRNGTAKLDALYLHGREVGYSSSLIQPPKCDDALLKMSDEINAKYARKSASEAGAGSSGKGSNLKKHRAIK